MSGGGWRRAAARGRSLRLLLRDTLRALRDVQDLLPIQVQVSATVESIGSECSRPSALVLLGSTAQARARLLHCLLGRRLLPEDLPRGCRWIRIVYGSSTQVHLTLGNSEFELVEDLECNRTTWDTLPLQDLIRQDSTDLTTVLEIELNNSFLKEGLRIIIPPDLEIDPGVTTSQQLKELYADFYQKRDSILRNYTPIYLYALDHYGRNIFSETINKMSVSKSDEDFWATFDLYGSNKVEKEEKIEVVLKESQEEYQEDAVFNAENCLDLHQIKEINPHSQILFVLFSDSSVREHRSEQNEATESTDGNDLTESERDLMRDGLKMSHESPEQKATIRCQEQRIAFMNELLEQWEVISTPPPKHHVKSQWLILDDTNILQNIDKTEEKRKRESASRTIRSRTVLINNVLKYATECSQSYVLGHCAVLSEIHTRVVQQLVLSSFELARELQVVPKKIQYVAKQEQHLYETINDKFSDGDKKQELLAIMQEVLEEMKHEVHNMDWSVDDLPCHQDRQFMISNSIFYTPRNTPSVSIRLNDIRYEERDGNTIQNGRDYEMSNRDADDLSDVEEALSYDSFNMDDYDVVSNDEGFGASQSFGFRSPIEASESIHIESERESESVSTSQSRCSNTTLSTKQASLDVQRTVLSKLSHKISSKLVNFVDCLKETYFGTLQRCLESLESCCRSELGGRPASAAMRAVAGVARAVDLQPCASFSLLRSILDSIRRMFYRLRVSSEEQACCVLSPVWRRQAALSTLASLSTHKLARIISTQILERLSVAHEKYQSALTSLENALTNRLHHTEDVKLTIRKKFAPLFARLCLESTSMCDLLMYGVPDLGREIGRGQYGVVYSIRGSWAGVSPVAAKSVLPADDRHYHELAMEFFYTRSIPPHPRIVRLLGSLVQRGADGTGVLLVSPRRARDLHAAVRAGLTFAQRMRISCDIVEGIRYLHSLGLVHRDIKLKNVLLDANERAALSDLGFCAASALVSGSLVGTPVHMAPELLAGRYQSAVDVYAFGILFWYLCAGSVRLPAVFESFQNKEQLWSKVKRGLRPERLPQFSDECWDIMQSCWASEPSQRALLGDVQPQLEAILQKALAEDKGHIEYTRNSLSDDDSLHMTGLDMGQ